VSTHPGFDGGTLYKDFLQIDDDVIIIILIIITLIIHFIFISTVNGYTSNVVKTVEKLFARWDLYFMLDKENVILKCGPFNAKANIFCILIILAIMFVALKIPFPNLN
jgi:hypothetical protein